MIPPRRIALSGGGMLGFAHIGALEVLQETGNLKCVREYIGTSAGAGLAFCLSIGYTLSEIRALLTVFNFTSVQNLEPEIMFGFIESYGIDNGANIEKFIGILLRAKGFSPEITFQEFFQKAPERPNLRIFATEITRCSLKEFSLKETPTVAIKFAVRASVSIPMIFTPVEDASGSLYVDGVIIAHFPFHILTDSERQETIGITFHYTKFSEKPAKITNIFDYFNQLYTSAYYHQEERLYGNWYHRIIAIQTSSSSQLNFDITTEEKEILMNAGRKSTAEFLKKTVKKAGRRYSSP